MSKKFRRIALVGFLIGQLVSCLSVPTIRKPAFRPFYSGLSISDEALQNIKKESPKDAVFADLLQAFALMRTGSIEQKATQKEYQSLSSNQLIPSKI